MNKESMMEKLNNALLEQRTSNKDKSQKIKELIEEKEITKGSLNKSMKDLNNLNENLKSEINEKLKFKEELDKFEEIERESNISKEKFESKLSIYDIIIRCNSFYKPFKIEMGKNLAAFANKKIPVVVILGSFDKGKSFFLNELTKKNFPYGYTAVTPSACGIFCGKENYNEGEIFLDSFIIDTAGFETPAEYVDENEIYEVFKFLKFFFKFNI